MCAKINPIDPYIKTNKIKPNKLDDSKLKIKPNSSNHSIIDDIIFSDSLGRDLVDRVRIVKAGDIESLFAYSAETKPGKASFTLARGDERFPNVWDENGGYYTPKKGDIIMGYGNAQEDWGIKHPDVLREMHEKGLTSYPDRAVSSEPELMYETYIGADGRDFQEAPLRYGETVDAVKKIFPAKFFFMPTGTFVETLEAREGAQKMPKLGNFQYIQLDAKGNPYVKDIKDLLKRLKPVGEKSKEIFAKVKEINSKREEIVNNAELDESAKDAMLSSLWCINLPELYQKH